MLAWLLLALMLAAVAVPAWALWWLLGSAWTYQGVDARR